MGNNVKSKIELGIIIPFYNSHKFISETIECLICQTFKDFIIILVDDGSDDNSLNIIKTFKDKRIHVVNSKHNGPGRARNIGLKYLLKHYETKYLLFLDSDDLYDSDFLLKLIKLAKNESSDVTICNSCLYDNQKLKIIENSKSINFSLLPKNKTTFDPIEISNSIFCFCVGWSWDKLIKTSLVKKYNLRFQELNNTEDAYFSYSAIALAKKISIETSCLVFHRTNLDNSVSNLKDKDISCLWKAITSIKEKLVKEKKYSIFEKGFIDWAFSISFWYLLSLHNYNSKKELFLLLKNKYFIELEICKYNKQIFHEKKYYKYYKLMQKYDYDIFEKKRKIYCKFNKISKLIPRNGNNIKEIISRIKSHLSNK